ncbi:hypothetical protein HMPREF9318_01237 [Streptococcus urinalis FB127-CNA-2]|uniref:Ser/Thr phosphatase family protein n=1 Tax=Streptococcus urinalis 2285-97 TaxID=764291 RepID=G5KC85_9STRE|nr:metallophosphoesterase [Streptococcus urinalis]EHJ56022.1 Ser/Thr phosphatase family protein [Streptococcus urinalis 2285-97]EKS19715.1 hypothetical protein HMPREF9318_01237 [Streptococcus urinalis FB127-CNA-2]VEF31292.1 3',5'-cyclic adenosine monophosphate phosphodiesterase CpdA [Streptococcus urinalis]
MRILHLSDTHIRCDYSTDWFTNGLFSEYFNPTANLRYLLTSLNTDDYDFAIITGDLTHEGDIEDYELFKSIWKDHMGDLPYYFCRGNHDQRDHFFDGMTITKKENDYYFNVADFNGLRIILLDSAQDESHEGKISETQMQELRSVLLEKSPKGSILLLHHPLIWEDPHISTSVPAGFEEIIKNSDIKAIFVGHIHMGSMASYAGIPQIMAESIAFGTDEYPDESVFLNRTGYNEVVIEDDKLFVYRQWLKPEQTILGQLAKPFDNSIFQNKTE